MALCWTPDKSKATEQSGPIGESLAMPGWPATVPYDLFEGEQPGLRAVTYANHWHSDRRKFGNSVTGGYVYRGDERSSFYGVYICGDYTSRRIFGVRQQGRTLITARQIGTAPQGIASFAIDERGEIYLVGYEGMVYRLDLSGTNFDEELPGQK